MRTKFTIKIEKEPIGFPLKRQKEKISCSSAKRWPKYCLLSYHSMLRIKFCDRIVANDPAVDYGKHTPDG
jgi:hypothetical protein